METRSATRHKYLFILSPPYSGSTALWRLLQTSAQVSALPDEGQKLPELREMMRRDPWDPQRHFDWSLISAVWHRHWDLDKPLLLEKSPPHLCRAAQLEAHFSPAWHILLLRDPLATCESLHRRNGLGYEEAALRWLGWLDLHLACRRTLPQQHLLYYEDLAGDPTTSVARLAAWLPELADVKSTAPVRSHSPQGMLSRPLLDLNEDKLAAIPTTARDAVIGRLRGAREQLEQTPYAARYL